MIMDLYSGLIKIVVLLSIFIYSDAVLGTFGPSPCKFFGSSQLGLCSTPHPEKLLVV